MGVEMHVDLERLRSYGVALSDGAAKVTALGLGSAPASTANIMTAAALAESDRAISDYVSSLHGAYDAASSGTHSHAGTYQEHVDDHADAMRQTERKIAGDDVRSDLRSGRPGESPSPSSSVPVDDKNKVPVSCTPGSDCPEDLKKQIDDLKDKSRMTPEKFAEDAFESAVGGAVAGGVIGGVVGSLADGVGAGPGFMTGATTGAVSGAIGSMVKDGIEWLEQ